MTFFATEERAAMIRSAPSPTAGTSSPSCKESPVRGITEGLENLKALGGFGGVWGGFEGSLLACRIFSSHSSDTPDVNRAPSQTLKPDLQPS